ncbi:MAG: hypothetical protein Q4G10_06835 [Bacteroidia bacterium]|nr:hypothetical protein [Bacteroidia bacterium]
MNKNIPELNSLLTEVENKFGKRIATSTDFESLSNDIEHVSGNQISASTLKRLWGYVHSNPTPRSATLDILCNYIGERNFKEFCINLKKKANIESGHFASKYIAVSEILPEQTLMLGWKPDRLVKIIYLGDFRFKVLSSKNSQLQVGDVFEATAFSLGFPLYIPYVLRGSEKLPSYIAGSFNGLTKLEAL